MAESFGRLLTDHYEYAPYLLPMSIQTSKGSDSEPS